MSSYPILNDIVKEAIANGSLDVGDYTTWAGQMALEFQAAQAANEATGYYYDAEFQERWEEYYTGRLFALTEKEDADFMTWNEQMSANLAWDSGVRGMEYQAIINKFRRERKEKKKRLDTLMKGVMGLKPSKQEKK